MQAAKDRSKRMGKNEVRKGGGTGQGSALETLGLEEFQAGVGGGQALLCSGHNSSSPSLLATILT